MPTPRLAVLFLLALTALNPLSVAPFALAAEGEAQADPAAGLPLEWTEDFPKTDWSRMAFDPAEITDSGPRRDSIPAIDEPVLKPAEKIRAVMDREPVIGLVIDGDARAYPLSILLWHEVVNDTVGGRPVAVTFCPLCGTAMVFDRRVDGEVLDFGVTGRLRNSGLILYDRATESWWQQFTGTGIAGRYMGTELAMVPARLESYGDFKARRPDGQVMIPAKPSARNYGSNPYWGYDTASRPEYYAGPLPADMDPMARVVLVEGRAWTLDLIRERESVTTEDGLEIRWTPGQVSPVDAPRVASSRKVGGVIVQRDGRDVPYVVAFAFAVKAMAPDVEVRR